MLRPEAKARRDNERKCLAAYWAGDRRSPFRLELQEAYCACDVVFPSPLAYLRLAFRATATRIASLLPLSPWKVFCYRRLGMKIGRGVFIAPQVYVDPMFPSLIEIGDDAVLGVGCRLFTHEYTATTFRIGPVRVGRGSVVGAFATVRPGVSVGSKVTVGFNSYVNRDVPDGETVGGVPAKPLRMAEEGR